MYRYADYKGIDTSNTDSSRIQSFTDRNQVSVYAVSAMTWATGTGLINGVGNQRVSPQESSTRAQVAQILKNYDTIF